MLLTNFIQLAADLAADTQFFIQKDDLQPITQIKLTSREAVLIIGTKPITKKKLFHILSQTHRKGIKLVIASGKQKEPVFGLQLQPEKKAAILM